MTSDPQVSSQLTQLGAEIQGVPHGDQTGAGITAWPIFMGGKQRLNPQAVCLKLKVTVSSLSGPVSDSGQADAQHSSE